MNDIRRVLKKAAVRLWMIGFMEALVAGICIALIAAIALRLVEQFFAIQVPWWPQVAAWGAGGAVFAAIAWSYFRRADADAVARRVDDGADLRESLSTALCVAAQPDPWSQATVQSAGQKARRVVIRDAVPVTAPRFMAAPIALAVALLIVFIAVPQRDLMGLLEARNEREAEKERIETVTYEADKIKELEKQLEKLDPTLDQGDAPEGLEEAEPKSAEEMIAVNMKKLTEISERLKEFQEGEKGQTMEALKQKLDRLKPGGAEMNDLARAMSKGDFKKAAEELQNLEDQMAAGEMNAEEAEAIKEQIEKMAEQMKKLAEDQAAMEQALEKMGLDKGLASDPEALKQALEKMSNLSEEQKQQLQDMAQAQKSACEACESMAQSMNKLAQSMSQNGELSQEAMEAMQGMQGQLSELEMMSEELDAADSAMGQCMSQLASMSQMMDSDSQGGSGLGESQMEGMGQTRPFDTGYSKSQGDGSGGPGVGRGGSPGQQQAATKWKTEKDLGVLGPGAAIGTRYVDGLGIKNAAMAEAGEVIAAASQEATESIEQNVAPREYHGAIKSYFGRLNTKVKMQKLEGTADETPAEDGAEPAAEEPADG